jgi:hypothetical protein
VASYFTRSNLSVIRSDIIEEAIRSGELKPDTDASTDGGVSHWKYIIGHINVYRDVYRACKGGLPRRWTRRAHIYTLDVTHNYLIFLRC